MKKMLFIAATSLAAIVLSIGNANAQKASLVGINRTYEAVWFQVDHQFDVLVEFAINVPNYNDIQWQHGHFEMVIHPNSSVTVQPYCYGGNSGRATTIGNNTHYTVTFCVVADKSTSQVFTFPRQTEFQADVYFDGALVERNVTVVFPAGVYSCVD